MLHDESLGSVDEHPPAIGLIMDLSIRNLMACKDSVYRCRVCKLAIPLEKHYPLSDHFSLIQMLAASLVLNRITLPSGKLT